MKISIVYVILLCTILFVIQWIKINKRSQKMAAELMINLIEYIMNMIVMETSYECFLLRNNYLFYYD